MKYFKNSILTLSLCLSAFSFSSGTLIKFNHLSRLEPLFENLRQLDLKDFKVFVKNNKKLTLQNIDSNYNRLIHIAAKEGFTDFVVVLLSSGADLSLKNSQKKTPYDLADDAGHKETAKVIEAWPSLEEKARAMNEERKKGMKLLALSLFRNPKQRRGMDQKNCLFNVMSFLSPYSTGFTKENPCRPLRAEDFLDDFLRTLFDSESDSDSEELFEILAF